MSVRYYDWIAHFGRRTPDKMALPSISPAIAGFSYRALRCAHLAACHPSARPLEGRARRPRRGAGAEHDDTLEVQFACGRLGAVFLPLNNAAYGSRTAVHRRRCLAESDDPRRRSCRNRADGREALQRASALLLGAGGSYEAAIASCKAARSTLRTSRSMTSRPSCTPRARPACRRARSSPTA